MTPTKNLENIYCFLLGMAVTTTLYQFVPKGESTGPAPEPATVFQNPFDVEHRVTAPDAIGDDIWTNPNVGIGTNTPAWDLDIQDYIYTTDESQIQYIKLNQDGN